MPHATTLAPAPRTAAVAVAVMVAVAAAAAPVVAHAQSAKDQAAAEALFRKGRDLMAAGDLAAACPTLAESQRLDPAVGTLLNLATCYEMNNQLASAWVTYTLAATAAQKNNQRDRVKLARSKAASLEPKVPTLTIAVPPGADLPDLQVKRDGELVGRAEWGTPIPVDAGLHVVEATAGGHTKWTGQAKVAGAGAKVTIEVQPLPAESPATSASAASASASAPASTTTAPAASSVPPPPSATAAPDAHPGSGQHVLGLVVGGVGLVGLGLGAYFGVTASSKNNTAAANCPTDTTCNLTGATAENDAKTNATASTVSFIAGGVLVAAGFTIWLLAPSSKHPADTSLQLVPAGNGLVLRGAW
jgi:hypothetical protein